MIEMLQGMLVMITSDMVPEKTYFLINLGTPQVLWAVRIICVIVIAIAALIYIKMKGKNRN